MAIFRIGYYLSDDYSKIKHIIEPFLLRIEDIDQGRWSLEHCISDIQSGDLIPWIVWDDNNPIAVITTRICQAKIKYLVFEDLAGDRLDEWVDQAYHSIELFARHIGCEQMTAGGRVGWQKYFKRFGFTKSRVEGFKRLIV